MYVTPFSEKVKSAENMMSKAHFTYY